MKILVYGTLKRGHDAHSLMGKAKFLGEYTTLPEYTMFDLGSYPGVIGSGALPVSGELYDVDEVTLKRLDRYEGHPNLYRRTELKEDDTISMYLYQRAVPLRATVISDGTW